MAIFHFYFHFLILALILAIVAAEDECEPSSCGPTPPVIRFPFRLKGRQPDHCGYPAGFQVSCNNHNETELDLQYPARASTNNIVIPISVKSVVLEIDYKSQTMRVSIVNASCFPREVPAVNSSSGAYPFESNGQYSNPYPHYIFFNCSSGSEDSGSGYSIPCLSDPGYRVYAFDSSTEATRWPLSCVKMYNISDVPYSILSPPDYVANPGESLKWSTPFCKNCEDLGKYCRLGKNSKNVTECYDPTPDKDIAGSMKKGMIAGITIGVLLISGVVGYTLYRIISLKKRKHKDQEMVEKFLEDYNALRPTRYSYADIKRITDKFKKKLGKGGYGMVYKGRISSYIPVAVKVLDNTKGNGEDFINEVGTIGRIHHINVVRLLGYCADGANRALVYEFLPNGSLQDVISSRKGQSLGWDKLEQIALGIARGIDYLHQGCNQRILHFDIKPHNILLDEELNPKVADFGLAKLCSKEKSVVSMTAARGTIGYISPEVFSRNFGNVSYKADVYSFGMLLLNLVGGRNPISVPTDEQESSQLYFPQWAYDQLEKGKEISIHIENEIDRKIVKKVTVVGLWCVQWNPADRPSMKVVIQMLEGENVPAMPPNPFDSPEPIAKAIVEGSLFDSEIETSY
ncbi:rust resistance kinase Lr10-like [Ipomoea triloba]|uniref:rust resistance kinase Lr10-like n=1 Tax=Ipomoea triloba TaxID=35885 RepID=UPI00125E0865|nr:rust resistance kinase Lr10-like [Ipomoea triloba]